MTDTPYVVRSLLRAPTFALASIATLALGMGIIAAVSSVVTASLRQLPEISEPDQLIMIKPTQKGRVLTESALADEDLRALQSTTLTSTSAPAGFGFFQAAFGSQNRSAIIKGEAVFGNYFPLLAVRPAMGRLLTAADEDASDAIVISEQLWRDWYRADDSVVGSRAQLGGRPFTIVGVVPSTFQGLHGGHLLGNEVWAPRRAVREFLQRTHVSAHTFARLTAGHTIQQADNELRSLRPRVSKEFSQAGLTAVPFVQQFATSPVALLSVGTVVVGLATLVLAACCGNLVSLFVARVIARHGELATRLMLGARQGQLLRLLAFEVVIIVGVATLLGGGVGTWAARLLSAVSVPLGSGLSARVTPAMDWQVLVALSLSGAASATLLVLALGRHVAHLPSLSQVGLAVGMAGSTGHSRRLRNTLTVAQVAVCISLLTLTALFARGLATVLRKDLPARADQTAVAWFDYGLQGTPEADIPRLNAELLRAAAEVPGAMRVSLSSDVPGFRRGRVVRVTTTAGRVEPVRSFIVSSGYFETFGYAVQDGSPFAEDAAATDVIINDVAAARWWSGERAIGRQILLPSNDPARGTLKVVGVVSNVSSLGGDVPTIFLPLTSTQAASRVALAVASTGGGPMIDATVAAAKSVQSALVPYDARSLREELTPTSVQLEAGAGVAGALALAACVVALVGLYGTVAHLTGRRKREIAIRMALGANARAIYRMIAREQAGLISVGTATGILLAIAAARILATYVNGLPVFDWSSSVVVPLLLAGVCIVAALLPVRSTLRAIGGFAALRE